MSYFAEIDDNGIVKRVIVAEQNFIDSGAVGDPKNWIETKMDGSLRKNYAGIGYQYDPIRNAFIEPKSHPDTILDELTCKWKFLVEKPIDYVDFEYSWDTLTKTWVKEKSRGGKI